MFNFIKNDFWLKLVSLLLAIGFWFYSVVVVNPYTDSTVANVQIKYTNKDDLVSKNLTSVAIEPSVIDVKFKAPRKLVDDITKQNLFATVDLGSIKDEGEFSLPINVVLPFEEAKVAEKSIYYAKVSVEELRTKTLPVVVNVNVENQTQKVFGQKVSKQNITVKAPKNVIDSVTSLGVPINLNAGYGDYHVAAPVKVYGDRGEIDFEGIYLEPKHVDFNCVIYKIKTVPLLPNYDFDASSGNVKLSSEKITIYGPEAKIDKISSVSTHLISQSVGKTTDVIPVLDEGIYSDDKITVETY